MTQPTLSLFAEPATLPTRRIVAHSEDRVAWLRARRAGVTATDAAQLSSARSVQRLVLEKLIGGGFGGNSYTDHGRAREPEIAKWVQERHGIAPSTALFRSTTQPLHLATPDGIALLDGEVVLAEIKTTNKPWRSIPRSYLRQVWWQQYVVGAERTLLVWEEHVDFVPVSAEPQCRWIERDDNQIHVLVGLANRVLELLHR
ncbi:hypothetical protein GCM10027052_18910 [Parafrigoribacterium mesophilum]|uniref:YqaJ viral recombinase family protein n=1 Tax=Parafrigoribacterium mesophilum TaxID=433646 RepID=UPI0031FBEE74